MTSSWYKEPWAWLVFGLPFTAVVAGISTYIIANHEPDPLVVGNYYKKGKAINFELAKIKHAQKLGMKFSLTLKEHELVIIPTGIEKVFSLLHVNFYHPTQEFKDFSLTLTPDGDGNFRQDIPQEVKGKWQVTLSTFDDKWKIQNTIYLPQSTAITIQPMLNDS